MSKYLNKFTPLSDQALLRLAREKDLEIWDLGSYFAVRQREGSFISRERSLRLAIEVALSYLPSNLSSDKDLP